MIDTVADHQSPKMKCSEVEYFAPKINCNVVEWDDEGPQPRTPKLSEGVVRAVTPEPGSRRQQAPDLSESDKLAIELEEARRDAQQSAEALDNLMRGIRLVKRILERDQANGDDTRARIEELKEISKISENLHGVLGSDLLGLLNAADMVREHARLSVNEASGLVHDVAEARQEAKESQACARQLKKISRALYKENTSLKTQVKQLRTERRALVKEVKSLRDEAEVTKKYDAWRLLEHHVLDSIMIHEHVLKTPTSQKQNDFVMPDSPVSDTASCDESANPIDPPDQVKSSSETSQETIAKADSDQEGASNQTPGTSNDSKPEEQATQTTVSKTPRTGLGGFSGLRNFFSPITARSDSPVQTPKTQQEKPAETKPDQPAKSEPESAENSQSDIPTTALTEEQPFIPETPKPNDEQLCSASKSTISSQNKSPVPGLEEASGCCTHDSSSGTCTRGSDDPRKPSPKLPAEFSFQIPDKASAPELASPLPSPHGSPAGIGIAQPKPICDEKILRTLAIPTGEGGSLEGQVLYARTTLESGLYEC